jgi:hypothetical protein
MRKANQKFGKIGSGVGFRKTDGIITPQEKRLSELEKKGYTIDRTPFGIIVTPPIKK